ncbi:MAG: NACHT domain-containing protein [Desulfobacteraceae bacterium]|nr:NACHT domain-containing protein [Desulfobacteraceae bacterium]
MKSFITGKSVLSTLRKRLDNDSSTLKDVGQITLFGTAIAIGEPITIGIAVANILKTAGSCISLCTNVIDKYNNKDPELDKLKDENEKFEVLYYVLCQQSYLTAVKRVFKQRELYNIKEGEFTPNPLDQAAAQQIESLIKDLPRMEIYYFFTAEPMALNVPLYSAYSEWLGKIFYQTGYDRDQARELIHEIEKEARDCFYKNISKRADAYDWIRNYLLINETVDSKTKIAETLAIVEKLAKNWLDKESSDQYDYTEEWNDYKDKLKELPDKKESMFNEEFGVRKVFVCPEVDYSRQGFDKALTIKNRDLGILLGGLLSNRNTNEDLIFLCGGPGSGKSTLCRLLCDRLARMDNVHPILLKLRKLEDCSDIGGFVEDSLKQLGLIDEIKDLKKLKNVILVLDGFDEVMMANKVKLTTLFRNLKDELDLPAFKETKVLIAGRDTLFPHGEGMPRGSHILELKPFNKKRVKLWGKKWAQTPHHRHSNNDFKPEIQLEAKYEGEKPAMHHLVSWPLTLHLVARIHASGLIDLSEKAKIEKAYVYKCILYDSIIRQIDKKRSADDRGRLEPKELHQFIMDIAWHMHLEGRDIIDAQKTDLFLKDLAFGCSNCSNELIDARETAVLNAPTFIGKDDRGIEFVHKSFLEYLTAESITQRLEAIHEKGTSTSNPDPVFFKSDNDVIRILTELLCIQPVTEEIAEYIQPMIGTYTEYDPLTAYDEKYSTQDHSDRLNDLILRLKARYAAGVKGEDLPEIINTLQKMNKTVNITTAHSLYVVGLLNILIMLHKRLNKQRFYMFEGIDGRNQLLATIALKHSTLEEAIINAGWKWITAVSHTNKDNTKKNIDTYNPFIDAMVGDAVRTVHIEADTNRTTRYTKITEDKHIPGMYIRERAQEIYDRLQMAIEWIKTYKHDRDGKLKHDQNKHDPKFIEIENAITNWTRAITQAARAVRHFTQVNSLETGELQTNQKYNAHLILGAAEAAQEDINKARDAGHRVIRIITQRQKKFKMDPMRRHRMTGPMQLLGAAATATTRLFRPLLDPDV